MLRKGIIRKLWRGTFMINPKLIPGAPKIIIIDAYLKNEYYIGLYTALRYWKLSDAPQYRYQILTVKRWLSGRRTRIENLSLRFIYINEDAFFGYSRYPYGGALVNVSDLEKTIIDAVYFLGRYVTIEDLCKALILAKNKINIEKLIRYLKRLDRPFINQRLGFLLEKSGMMEYSEEIRRKLKISNRYVFLDPYAHKKEYARSPRWRILINRKLQL